MSVRLVLATYFARRGVVLRVEREAPHTYYVTRRSKKDFLELGPFAHAGDAYTCVGAVLFAEQMKQVRFRI